MIVMRTRRGRGTLTENKSVIMRAYINSNVRTIA